MFRLLHRRWPFAALALASLAANATPATPCDGVSRQLTAADKAAWSAPVAQQLGVARVEVLQSFAFGGWRIVYVNTFETDEAFLFYHGDPRHTHYLTFWAGAAGEDETADTRRWVLQQAPGIPPTLAACFAWHVTQHRDQ